jgi:hypothetical protein
LWTAAILAGVALTVSRVPPEAPSARAAGPRGLDTLYTAIRIPGLTIRENERDSVITMRVAIDIDGEYRSLIGESNHHNIS